MSPRELHFLARVHKTRGRTHERADVFVRLMTRGANTALRHVGVVDKSSRFGHQVFLRAGIRQDIYIGHLRRPLRTTRRGLPEENKEPWVRSNTEGVNGDGWRWG